ncbi:hypothetical protein A2U01_0072912, partial [Trifolium medium]|nr:hypothetical protein [Trifolium medium]
NEGQPTQASGSNANAGSTNPAQTSSSIVTHTSSTVINPHGATAPMTNMTLSSSTMSPTSHVVGNNPTQGTSTE